MVATSCAYIANGSSSLSPNLNAGVGDVGDARTSVTLECLVEVLGDELRTFCAEP